MQEIKIDKISENALIGIKNLLDKYNIIYTVDDSKLELLECQDNIQVYIEHLTPGMLALYDVREAKIEGINTKYNDPAGLNDRIVILVMDFNRTSSYRRYTPTLVD